MTASHNPKLEPAAQVSLDEKAKSEALAAEKRRSTNRKGLGIILVVAALGTLNLKPLNDPTKNSSYLIGYYSIQTLMLAAGIFMLVTSPPKPKK